MKTYESWLIKVREALANINMPLEDWQRLWKFDFEREYKAETLPDAAAMKANRYWWHEQNISLRQDCQKIQNCWLPRRHQGECQPISLEGAVCMIGTVEEIAFTTNGYQITMIDGKKYATLFDLTEIRVKEGKRVEYELPDWEPPYISLPYAKIIAVLEE